LEVTLGVVGSRRGLRVVLDRENGRFAMPNPFYGAIIEVEVRHLKSIGTGYAPGIALNREPVVL
jgi:hypothetical protein